MTQKVVAMKDIYVFPFDALKLKAFIQRKKGGSKPPTLKNARGFDSEPKLHKRQI